MQLTISFLDYKHSNILESILQAFTDCDCQIAELRISNHSDINTGFALIDGNWNHIAKLESSLSALEQNHNIGLHMCRIEKPYEYSLSVPYFIEIIALDKKDILINLMTFFSTRNINILEISSSSYPAQHVNSTLLSSKFIIAVPETRPLFTFRDEFLDYCDHHNIDAILEPLKNKTL